MNWVFFALLAPFFLTITTFLDKYIVEDHVHDHRAMTIYVGVIALFYGTVFWIVAGGPLLSLDVILLTMFKGSLIAFTAVLYFKAMSTEQASSVIILTQTAPILVLVLSFIFLGEVITLAQLAGFMLILVAAISISLARSEQSGALRLSPAFWLISAGNTLLAVSLVLAKYIIDRHHFMDIAGYESWGLALGALIIYLFVPSFRQVFNHSVRVIPRSGLAFIFLSESIFTVAKLMNFAAFELGGPVALVSVLASTQIFIGLLFGWALTLISPATFKEDIARVGLAKKAVFAMVMFIGVQLVS